MIHLISNIVNHNFEPNKLELKLDDKCIKNKSPVGIRNPKINVYFTGKKNNFGKVVECLEYIFPNIYSMVTSRDRADLINDNTGFLGWYIDGSELFTLKENLGKVSSYSVDFYPPTGRSLWISKPSHPHIGSGKNILIGSKTRVQKRPTMILNKIPVKWVLQPLLTDLILWKDTHKFDIRMYAVIFNQGDKYRAGVFNVCFGRKSVNPHDPIKDPFSAITNISIQEKLPGYSYDENMILMLDDQRIGLNIITELMKNTPLQRDPRKAHQILILGLDIMFHSNGKPILIEVNTDPYLSSNNCNAEEIASTGFISGVFGCIIPSLYRNYKIPKIKHWEFTD